MVNMKKTGLIFAFCIILLLFGNFTSALTPNYIYDENDRLSLADYGNYKIYYAYDSDGNLISEKKEILIDKKKIVSEVSYKYSNGRLAEINSLEGKIEYDYDSEGRIIKATDNSEITTYDYDEQGRVVCINCQDDADGIAETYTYDENDNAIGYSVGNQQFRQEFDEQGRLTKKISDSGFAVYEYDENGNLEEISDSGFFGESAKFEDCGEIKDGESYDANCNLLEDKNYKYIYDSDGRLKEKTEKTSSQKTKYGYDSSENLIKIEYADKTTEEFSYSAGLKITYKDRNGKKYAYLTPGDESSLAETSDKVKLTCAKTYSHEYVGNCDEKQCGSDKFIKCEQNSNQAKVQCEIIEETLCSKNPKCRQGFKETSREICLVGQEDNVLASPSQPDIINYIKEFAKSIREKIKTAGNAVRNLLG